MRAPNSLVRVAIVDTGIEPSHPDIGEISGGVGIYIHEGRHPVFSDNFVDSYGHGTACAGIVLKKTPDAEIFSVRIFEDSLIADGRTLTAAIQWCVDNQIHIANLSLGTTDVTFKAELRKVCKKAIQEGLIIVGAQNNEATESFPAVFPEVIGVTGGNIRKDDEFYFRPNYWIECVAKGDEQWVCWLNGKHIRSAGNSFAAPHITGLVANLLKQHPEWSLPDIRSWLQDNASRVIPHGQSLEELPQVDIPVICIIGTSPPQGEFKLQSAIAKTLMHKGFRVARLDEISPNTTSPKTYIPHLDRKFRKLCQQRKPDIILAGARSNVIPFDPIEDGIRSISSLAFLIGARPDACILIINSNDPIEYIRDTIDGIRAFCKAPTLALAIGDRENRRNQPEQPLPSTIGNLLNRLEDTFQMPAVSILWETGQRRLVDTVIQHFKSE